MDAFFMREKQGNMKRKKSNWTVSFGAACVCLSSMMFATSAWGQQIAYDAFTGSGQLSAHTSDSGHTWSVPDMPGQLLLSNGKLDPASGSSEALGFLNVPELTTADYRVTADVSKIVDASNYLDHSVAVRASMTGLHTTRTGYVAYLLTGNAGPGTLHLRKYVNGIFVSSMGSYTVGTWTTGTIGVSAVGDQIRAYWNGTAVIGPITDGAISQVGSPSLGAWAAADHRDSLYDNFTVALETSPTTTTTTTVTTAATTTAATTTTTLAWAHTYYVAPTGNDTSGVGSQQSPWRTIGKALQMSYVGDGILVADGWYDECITPVRSGADGAPIAIQAQGSEAWVGGLARRERRRPGGGDGVD